MKEKTLNAARIIVLSAVFASAIGYSLADWVPPPQPPPFGNTPPPINVGGATQVKEGNLFLEKLLFAAKARTLPTVDSDSGDTLVTKDWILSKIVPPSSLESNSCNSATFPITSTNTYHTISLLLKDGRNMCDDAGGCSYRIWRFSSTNPQGDEFYTTYPIMFRQISTNRWFDAKGNQKGVNGDGVKSIILRWLASDGITPMLKMWDDFPIPPADNPTFKENNPNLLTFEVLANKRGYIVEFCDY